MGNQIDHHVNTICEDHTDHKDHKDKQMEEFPTKPTEIPKHNRKNRNDGRVVRRSTSADRYNDSTNRYYVNNRNKSGSKKSKNGYIVDDKLIDLVQDINELVQMYHDTDLTKDDEVYKIWTDGAVTIEKGGEDYGYETIYICMQALYHIQVYNKALKFPCTYHRNEEESFAIVTFNQAKIVRELVRDLLNSTYDLHPEIFPKIK